jgi:hypothetical protein
MNYFPGYLYLRTVVAALGLAVVAPGAAIPAASADAFKFPDCSAPDYHQMDFWVGDWDTFETDAPNGPSVARAQVDPIAQGCAIHELYEQGDGLIGDSILSYDPVRKQWQQTWVTNRGSIMVLYGGLKDGVMVLEGEVHLNNGTTVLQRISWKAQGAGVREWAVLSKDGGKTWTPSFDVLFLRRPGSRDQALGLATVASDRTPKFSCFLP